MTRRTRPFEALALAALVPLGTGCATPAGPQAMAVAMPAKAARQLPYSVSVATSGGAETNPMGLVNISDADFKAAIEESIRSSGLFREVAPGKAGQFQLSVLQSQMTKPMFGSSFTVELETGWSLIRASDGQVVFRKAIKSAHTATIGDAFVGVRRMQLAVEGAARSNIELGLAAIAELPVGIGQTAGAGPAPGWSP